MELPENPSLADLVRHITEEHQKLHEGDYGDLMHKYPLIFFGIDGFRLSQLPRVTKKLVLGKDTIHPEGKILSYDDNYHGDFPDYVKADFPEVNFNGRPMAVVEIAGGSRALDERNVEFIVNRYHIHESPTHDLLVSGGQLP